MVYCFGGEGPQRLQETVCQHRQGGARGDDGRDCKEFQNARFGLWCAYHDTFATGAQEMMMSGMPVVAAKHGLASEIPAWSASGVRAQVEAIKRLANETDESLEEQSDRISKWAVENVSYAAFQGQLKEVLRSVCKKQWSVASGQWSVKSRKISCFYWSLSTAFLNDQ